jgi:hypothetical protein
MILTTVQDQAIAARMALIVGGTTFDRLFVGVRFDEVDGDVLFVFAKDEETAAGGADEPLILVFLHLSASSSQCWTIIDVSGQVKMKAAISPLYRTSSAGRTAIVKRRAAVACNHAPSSEPDSQI